MRKYQMNIQIKTKKAVQAIIILSN